MACRLTNFSPMRSPARPTSPIRCRTSCRAQSALTNRRGVAYPFCHELRPALVATSQYLALCGRTAWKPTFRRGCHLSVQLHASRTQKATAIPWPCFFPNPFERSLCGAFAMKSNDYPVQSLMYITNRPDTVFISGKGSWLTDSDGKRYLDFLQGWAVNCLGHCPDFVIEALDVQARKLINPSPAFYNE